MQQPSVREWLRSLVIEMDQGWRFSARECGVDRGWQSDGAQCEWGHAAGRHSYAAPKQSDGGRSGRVRLLGGDYSPDYTRGAWVGVNAIDVGWHLPTTLQTCHYVASQQGKLKSVGRPWGRDGLKLGCSPWMVV